MEEDIVVNCAKYIKLQGAEAVNDHNSYTLFAKFTNLTPSCNQLVSTFESYLSNFNAANSKLSTPLIKSAAFSPIAYAGI